MEMSRLARSCKDWHALLELCAIYRTLLADADGLYDPSQYNDRLLLGLKGATIEWNTPLEFSEAAWKYIAGAPAPDRPEERRPCRGAGNRAAGPDPAPRAATTPRSWGAVRVLGIRPSSGRTGPPADLDGGLGAGTCRFRTPTRVSRC